MDDGQSLQPPLTDEQIAKQEAIQHWNRQRTEVAQEKARNALSSIPPTPEGATQHDL